MARLENVTIRGYRSIKEASVPLTNLNVLIGANGAGKSNFISFFKLLNEMMGGRLQEYVGRTGRAKAALHFGPKTTPQMEASLKFVKGDAINTYCMRLFHAAGDTLVFAEETLDYQRADWKGPSKGPLSLDAGHSETRIGEFAENGNKTAGVFRHLLNACRVYHFHDTSPEARIRNFGYINDGRWLRPDAGNLAAVLFAYQTHHPLAYRRIVSTIRDILPEFDEFDLKPSELNPKDIALDWRMRGRDYLFAPHQLSDGSLRAIALCALLLQPANTMPDLIVLDEPELGLHPYALEIVAGLVRAASETTQVIVATQSQAFVSFFAPSEVVVVDSKDGQSSFRRLADDELGVWLEDFALGELWARNVVGGGPMR